MSDEITIKEIEVQKLRLRPGDVLMVTVPEGMQHSRMAKLAQHLNRILPRNPALIVSSQVHVSVVSQEEAEKIKQETTSVDPTKV